MVKQYSQLWPLLKIMAHFYVDTYATMLMRREVFLVDALPSKSKKYLLFVATNIPIIFKETNIWVLVDNTKDWCNIMQILHCFILFLLLDKQI